MGNPTTPLENIGSEPNRANLVRLPFFESDAAIVAALRAGQAAGGAALYDRHRSLVRRVLIRLIGPDAELGDLIQDVFVAAIDGIEQLQDPSALKSWLASIAVFRARAEFRARARRRLFPLFRAEDLPERPGVDAGPEITETLRATYRVLELLAPDDRIVFVLRHIERLELTEIAALCKVSLATAKRRIARAQKRFAAIGRRYSALDDWLDGGAAWT